MRLGYPRSVPGIAAPRGRFAANLLARMIHLDTNAPISLILNTDAGSAIRESQGAGRRL